MLTYGIVSSTNVRTDGRNTIPAHRSPESIEVFAGTLLMV
jgi:hypothetical protein